MSNNLIYLEELLRKVKSLILPTNVLADTKYLLKRKNTDKFKKTCFLPIIFNKKSILCLPICNRYEFIDPKVIEFSLKLIELKLSNIPEIDKIELFKIKNKLEKLLIKYSKEIPKSKSMAIIKSRTTRKFNKEMKGN